MQEVGYHAELQISWLDCGHCQWHYRQFVCIPKILDSHINCQSMSLKKISTNQWAWNICQKELLRERLLANVKVDLACTICVNASAIGSNKSWTIVVLMISWTNWGDADFCSYVD